MRKGCNGEKGGEEGGERGKETGGKEKKIASEIVATNVVAIRPPIGDRLQRQLLV